MKSIRNIPFGYTVENGEFIRHQEEKRVVVDIFEMYIKGMSLNEIARSITYPYNDSNPEWNKSKVKRVLENEKYLGDDKYPQIITEEQFRYVQGIITNKRGQKIILEDDLQIILDKSYCHRCGKHISRKLDGRKNETWLCNDCYYGYRITDDMMRFIILSVLNTLIANPDMVNLNKAKSYQPTDEIIRREQNISQKLNAAEVDVQEIIKLILYNSEQKYKECSDYDNTEKSNIIKHRLSEFKSLGSIDTNLLSDIVEEIQPETDYSFYIKLTNGKTIQHKFKRGEE